MTTSLKREGHLGRVLVRDRTIESGPHAPPDVSSPRFALQPRCSILGGAGAGRGSVIISEDGNEVPLRSAPRVAALLLLLVLLGLIGVPAHAQRAVVDPSAQP